MSNNWEYVVKGGKHKVKSQLSKQEKKELKGNTSIKPNSIKASDKPQLDVNPTRPPNDTYLSAEILSNIKAKHKELSDKLPHNQPAKVLLDLSAHINQLLKANSESINTFDNSTIRGLFNGLNNAQMGNFLKSAMIQILEDCEKSVKPPGLFLLVRTCLRMKPIALIANRDSIFDLLRMYRDNSPRFMCLVSLLKEACLNVNLASQIWLIYLLPFVNQRLHTETVLQFSEDITKLTIESGGNDGTVQPADLISLIEVVNVAVVDINKKDAKKAHLSEADLRRLRNIYERIKNLIFSGKTIKGYFIPLLLRLSPGDKSKAFNRDLLECIDRSLICHPESICLLGDVFYNHPQQTILLLNHLSSGLSTSASMVKKQNYFKPTVRKIHSSTAADEAGSVHRRLHKLTAPLVKSGGCCDRLIKSAVCVALLLAATVAVMWSAFPDQYAVIREAAQSAAFKGWSEARPWLEVGLSQARLAGRYAYAKADEVAPSALQRLSEAYLAAEIFLGQQYEAASAFLSGPQFQAVVKATADRTAEAVAEVRLAYVAASRYVATMVGL